MSFLEQAFSLGILDQCSFDYIRLFFPFFSVLFQDSNRQKKKKTTPKVKTLNKYMAFHIKPDNTINYYPALKPASLSDNILCLT